MRPFRTALFVTALALAAPAGIAPATAQTAAFGFEDALRIGMAGVEKARASGRAITIVVVNREGRVLAAMRMDGTSHLQLDVAEAKASTAAATGVPTAEIEKAVESGKSSLLSVPGIGAIGGGLPVTRGGQVVAGVGVSGGSPEDDQAAAQAAITQAEQKGARR